MSSFRYRIYGLTLQSPLVLPCPRVNPSWQPDVRLDAGTAARFARARAEIGHPTKANEWFHRRHLGDGATYLQWRGLFEFLISRQGRRILYRRLKNATSESFNVYLLGQVLSFSLVALGIDPLHGTAVVINGEAVGFLGNCGSGKSTLGAALLARGFPVLTDDLIALEQHGAGWTAHPGIPRLKLFPFVARRVLGHCSDGTPMNSGTSKLVLPLRGGQATGHLVPLKALYVLADSKQAVGDGKSKVRVEPLSGREAFLEVIRAAFNLLVVDRQRLANQFVFATRLTDTVPVRRLTYPRNLSVLPGVCDAVLADLGALGA